MKKSQCENLLQRNVEYFLLNPHKDFPQLSGVGPVTVVSTDQQKYTVTMLLLVFITAPVLLINETTLISFRILFSLWHIH